jgi:adenylate cyclase class 2
MPDEIEAKFKVDGFAAVRRALRNAGADYASTCLQTDSYYDTPGRRLLAQDCGVRIREVRVLRSAGGKVDARPLLTMKGPRRGARAKVRPEVQARLDAPGAAQEIMRAMGLEVAVRLQKRRTTYRLGECLVLLDELPLAGRFVEIEAPSEDAVRRAGERLGLEGQPITDHYVALVLAECRKRGHDGGEITFDRFEE